MTKWRDIPGFDGYQASDDGQVRSLKDRNGPPGPLVLKMQRRNGYPVVTVKDSDGRRRTPGVHRLVLLAFVGPPAPGQRVCRHLDGNRENNAVDNLRWGTHAENASDAIKHGTLNQWWGSRTHCRRGHEYTEANTRINAAGHRECRACAYLRQRQRYDAEGRPATGPRLAYSVEPDFRRPSGSAVDELRDIKAAAMTADTTPTEPEEARA